MQFSCFEQKGDFVKGERERLVPSISDDVCSRGLDERGRGRSD